MKEDTLPTISNVEKPARLVEVLNAFTQTELAHAVFVQSIIKERIVSYQLATVAVEMELDDIRKFDARGCLVLQQQGRQSPSRASVKADQSLQPLSAEALLPSVTTPPCQPNLYPMLSSPPPPTLAEVREQSLRKTTREQLSDRRSPTKALSRQQQQEVEPAPIVKITATEEEATAPDTIKLRVVKLRKSIADPKADGIWFSVGLGYTTFADVGVGNFKVVRRAIMRRRSPDAAKEEGGEPRYDLTTSQRWPKELYGVAYAYDLELPVANRLYSPHFVKTLGVCPDRVLIVEPLVKPWANFWDALALEYSKWQQFSSSYASRADGYVSRKTICDRIPDVAFRNVYFTHAPCGIPDEDFALKLYLEINLHFMICDTILGTSAYWGVRSDNLMLRYSDGSDLVYDGSLLFGGKTSGNIVLHTIPGERVPVFVGVRSVTTLPLRETKIPRLQLAAKLVDSLFVPPRHHLEDREFINGDDISPRIAKYCPSYSSTKATLGKLCAEEASAAAEHVARVYRELSQRHPNWTSNTEER